MTNLLAHLAHLEISSPDVEASVRFFEAGFGLREVSRDEDGTVLVHHIEPGDVLEPDSAKTRKALLDTRHFELTRKRATTDATTDAPLETAVANPEEQA